MSDAGRTYPEEVSDVPPYNERIGPVAYEDRNSGPALAAILAAGVGTFVLGLATTLAEISQGVKDSLNLYDPVGPLSGKTMVSVVAWAASWLIFGLLWRKREVDVRIVVIVTAVLIGLGFLGTFPAFFERFAAE